MSPPSRFSNTVTLASRLSMGDILFGTAVPAPVTPLPKDTVAHCLLSHHQTLLSLQSLFLPIHHFLVPLLIHLLNLH